MTFHKKQVESKSTIFGEFFFSGFRHDPVIPGDIIFMGGSLSNQTPAKPSQKELFDSVHYITHCTSIIVPSCRMIVLFALP